MNPVVRSKPMAHATSRPPGAATRVAVVARVPLLREGIAMLLREEPSVAVGLAVASVEDLSESDAIDVVVLFVDDPHGAAQQVAVLRGRVPSPRVIGFHDGFPLRSLRGLQREGFELFVDISADEHAVVDAVRGLRSRTLLRWEAPRVGSPPLTGRERAVLSRVASGASSREIAESLLISIHTVENYKQRAFRKLGAGNQAQAVASAMRLGLLDGVTERAR
jgi:DNA-binding NarL/FixJ family response regulator